MRLFSTRLKSTNFDNLAVGVGKKLTDDQIIIYALKGRYGDTKMRQLLESGFRLTKYGKLIRPADNDATASSTSKATVLGKSLASEYLKRFCKPEEKPSAA